MSVQLFPEATQEQRMMADSAIRIMEAACPLTAVRAAAERPGPRSGSRSGPGDEKLWRKLGDLGCFRLLAAEQHGGGNLSGNGVADAAILAAERGALLQPGPFVAAQVVAGALSRAGSTPLQGEVLQALLSGAAAATWAADWLTAAARAPGLTLRDEPGKLTASGEISGVQDADVCDWILVSTRAGGTDRQFLLNRSAAGLSLAKAEGLDITRRYFTLVLNDVRVPAGAVLGDPASSTALADWQLAVAAVLSAAESVGAMDANFALALAHAKTRVAFGRPIGSFQGLKHLLARASLALEMAKAVVAGAAESLGGDEADALVMASIARAFVSENAVQLTHDCFQVFGGIGFTWEHDQHLYMRRLASEAYLFGSPSWHRRRIWDRAAFEKEAADA